MANRVTEKQLQSIVDRINTAMDMPATAYKPYDPEIGRAQPNAGAYHLSHAYGGVSLHRMSLTPGCTGVYDVFSMGHMPKRQLADMMFAFLRGIEAKQNV